ncbi:hypothetical protein [Arthrobacter agilis]|uniref:hypothetical protein n=1 Tax=Arthrobacter agilis TaxID=37921 RepID=UPI001ABF0325|nr:hypothetical protein [Arthrobacter agilis]
MDTNTTMYCPRCEKVVSARVSTQLFPKSAGGHREPDFVQYYCNVDQGEIPAGSAPPQVIMRRDVPIVDPPDETEPPQEPVVQDEVTTDEPADEKL